MNKQYFILANQLVRDRAISAVREARDGMVVEVKEPTRTLEENAKLHAMLTELSRELYWYGKKLNVEIWKRLCVAAWLREKGEKPLLIPSLDNAGVDIIYEKTSQMSVKQVSELIEWVYAFGAENGVEFNE